MAKQQAAARKPSRPKRDKQQESGSGAAANGPDAGAATYEQELTEYLTERIKPGLNRGAIPLLARSLAKEIARRNEANAAAEESDVDDEPRTEADDEFDDEPRAGGDDEEFEDEADDEPEDEADDEEFEDEADDEPEAEADDEEFEDEADDEPEAEADDEEAEADADDEDPAESEVSAFEDEMHELQADLGDEWILRFSVQGDEAWLTAEKQDGSQHLEAPTADLLREAVDLLDEGGGR